MDKYIFPILNISIHAPRVRCDASVHRIRLRHCHFNPRTSCEVRLSFVRKETVNYYFNPRTSCEVRPCFQSQCNETLLFQSTHLVWGATLSWDWLYLSISDFNPRTSCEVRLEKSVQFGRRCIFQSTHLVWGATRHWFEYNVRRVISIHAPRVRCDYHPLAPKVTNWIFQSTHLVWGATNTFYNHLE